MVASGSVTKALLSFYWGRNATDQNVSTYLTDVGAVFQAKVGVRVRVWGLRKFVGACEW